MHTHHPQVHVHADDGRRRPDEHHEALRGTRYQSTVIRRRAVRITTGVAALVVAALVVLAFGPGGSHSITRSAIEQRGAAWPFAVGEIAVQCGDEQVLYLVENGEHTSWFLPPAVSSDLPALRADVGRLDQVAGWAAVQDVAAQICS